MLRLLEKQPILTITAVALLLLLPNLTALEISIMEARNFISAREMLTDGNWILTTLNGEPRYQKPPLPTWLTALSALAFGIENVWALRLPTALMVVFLGIGVFKLSRKLNLPTSQSLISGLVAITSLYTVLIIFEAPWDIYAHTFMLWSIYFLACWFKKEKVFRSGFLFVVFMAASILSKGPVSLYVLFLSFLVAYFVSFRDVLNARRIGYLIGLVLVGLLVGFSWYGYVRFVDPETFVKITAKETSNWSSYNVRPFYYYWSFFVQSGIWTIPAFVSLLYPYLKKRVSNGKEYKFAVLWVLVAVVLLSVIPEKKSRYLMPVLIPLSLTVGFYLQYVATHFSAMKDWREKVPVYFHFGLIGVVFIGTFVFIFYTYYTSLAINEWQLLCCTFISILGILIFNKLLKGDIFKVLVLSIFGLLVTANAFFYTLDNQKTKGLYDWYIDDNGQFPITTFDELKDLPIYGYNGAPPEVVWEFGNKLSRIKRNNRLVFPMEDQFYALEFFDSTETIKKDFVNYEVLFWRKLELNKVKPDDPNYKNRRKATIYKIKKID